jgi:2'-5' RNA ligase
MNHFFAITLSSEARQAVTDTAQDWKRLLLPTQHATWYGPDDYHITLKFLSDIPDASVTPLIEGMTLIASAAAPFALQAAGIGMVPDHNYPRVLWAGVAPCPPLAHLVAQIEDKTASLGYPRDTRAYRPHITVARCRFAIEGEEWPVLHERSFPIWTVDKFALMQTLPPEQRRNGLKARYNTVHLFPFGTPPSYTE